MESYIKYLLIKFGIKNICKLYKNKNKIKIKDLTNELKLEKNSNIKRTTIRIQGKNNIIFIKEETNLNRGNINIFGNNNQVIIEENVIIDAISIEIKTDKNKIFIGKGTTIGELKIWCIEKDKKVIIGKNCMLSYGIDIRTSDAHPIYEINTNEILNYGKNVEIKDKVWIAAYVSLLKGVTIEEGCVIGKNSIITKSIEEKNCVAVGNGKIVKRNIRWERNFEQSRAEQSRAEQSRAEQSRAINYNIFNSINKTKKIA